MQIQIPGVFYRLSSYDFQVYVGDVAMLWSITRETKETKETCAQRWNCRLSSHHNAETGN